MVERAAGEPLTAKRFVFGGDVCIHVDYDMWATSKGRVTLLETLSW